MVFNGIRNKLIFVKWTKHWPGAPQRRVTGQRLQDCASPCQHNRLQTTRHASSRKHLLHRSATGWRCLPAVESDTAHALSRPSTQLREMLCTGSQHMLVLSSTAISRYYNCCTDRSTRPGNYGCFLRVRASARNNPLQVTYCFWREAVGQA
jgi:hypothetical protein